MGLQITLKQSRNYRLHLIIVLTIAKDAYEDLLTGYGFEIREKKILNTSHVSGLIQRLNKQRDEVASVFDVTDVVSIVTACDITGKLLATERWEKIVARYSSSSDVKAQQRMKEGLAKYCQEIFSEIGEQALFRAEVAEQKEILKELVPDF